MRYYMIEQDQEEEDEAYRTYLEVNDAGIVQRCGDLPQRHPSPLPDPPG